MIRAPGAKASQDSSSDNADSQTLSIERVSRTPTTATADGRGSPGTLETSPAEAETWANRFYSKTPPQKV